MIPLLLTLQNNITVYAERQYDSLGKGKECHAGSTYTRKENSKCDGWSKVSLEDCKRKCDSNELPIKCAGSLAANNR